ncbi:PREDICTED: syntenin-1 isoform X4 [Colobus angolensis palliatus]|uniref:PDZ domain-containing protein n=1 Tax=Colobus angolensis palliatus TaxID=336983 RepID=A0A2K5H9N8_COLAP|nr:PREDICTED: syntenin-1 isoform X4 [Colobus angolensis palliatus]
MSLYPSLEDLKVDKVIQAQTAFSANPANPAILSEASAPISQDGNLYPKLYPELSQYMGLSLNEEEIHANVVVVSGAPLQGLVQANSPASLVGLRFGDQVLQINGENCAGWSSDKAHKVLKQAFGEKITMTIRDRPFERTITMHKDSTGHVGFIFKNGKITSIVKDSSAARNGLLTEHNICEINGQNVIGLKDSQIADILSTSGTVVTITIMPAFIFEHIIKRMAPSIMKSLMDHTIPEV